MPVQNSLHASPDVRAEIANKNVLFTFYSFVRIPCVLKKFGGARRQCSGAARANSVPESKQKKQPALNDRRAAFESAENYFMRRSFFTAVKVPEPSCPRASMR